MPIASPDLTPILTRIFNRKNNLGLFFNFLKKWNISSAKQLLMIYRNDWGSFPKELTWQIFLLKTADFNYAMSHSSSNTLEWLY